MRIEIRGKIARHLAEHDALGDAEHHALRRSREARRAQIYNLHGTALPNVHQAPHADAAELGVDRTPAERKAYRIYAERLENAVVPAVSA